MAGVNATLNFKQACCFRPVLSLLCMQCRGNGGTRPLASIHSVNYCQSSFVQMLNTWRIVQSPSIQTWTIEHSSPKVGPSNDGSTKHLIRLQLIIKCLTMWLSNVIRSGCLHLWLGGHLWELEELLHTATGTVTPVKCLWCSSVTFDRKSFLFSPIGMVRSFGSC